MSDNLANLNVNPCKMCMPMGAVAALSGIRGCMSILHGSQGCATYIRRHMATHYNEPVDVASSSLTEQGTVFGGEANLLKGLGNLIDLYHPEAIGVCTTCLAETIGEDVGAAVKKFYGQNPSAEVKIVTVASPGYGGTQNEGWFAALRALVEQAEADPAPNGKINVVAPQLSPADVRWLKGFLRDMGLEFILLPDISENLDGATEKRYNRLKTGGTSLAEVGRMAGARLTVEFSEFTDDKLSPAAYLNEAHGVPLVRLPLPVGIRAMDALTAVLVDAGGVATADMEKARGRYLDAMADSHKHNADARVAVFGEPDFVNAAVRLCCENGALPVLAATASATARWREALAGETAECREFRFAGELPILEDSDFAAIEEACRAFRANVMIGSSDGRRAARRLGVPLIRCAFPIHDYVGGQRTRILGFEGSLSLLDQVSNAMIERVEANFRDELRVKYREARGEPAEAPAGAAAEAKRAAHPCFDEGARQNARVHLPVAPKCNIQCGYCLRGFDCVNESRPGVTSRILTPLQALERYLGLRESMPNLTVAGVAGPGDALANFEETRETLRLIRERDPDVAFCVATNGLLLPLYVSELSALGVSHVTVTVNAVDPAIGAKIHRHVAYMGETYEGLEGAAILLANQLAGIKMLKEAGMACKVNCVTLKGINDGHVYEVTKKVAALGASITNIMPHIPVKGSAFEGLDRVSNKEIEALRELCGANVKQMAHCRQCRSDAAGTLDEDASPSFRETSAAPAPPAVPVEYSRFAVATKSGTIVDAHFGHASEFHIYDSDGGDARFIETRQVSKYCEGPDCDGKEDKWESVIRAVADCKAVLALRIGLAPEKRLKEHGIAAITTYERVDTAVKEAALSMGNRERSA
ncbi:MAG: radical SAM protein [Clostridiales Family XIII bacterium]|jgi:nitrogenase molybdenum-iron protein alpha/beta subunit/MoaA/NifB/PqqE/SkfB family radical SAM enzyme|nr:radical SAM protein [Clostridiales Family XIII bacterium]